MNFRREKAFLNKHDNFISIRKNLLEIDEKKLPIKLNLHDFDDGIDGFVQVSVKAHTSSA